MALFVELHEPMPSRLRNDLAMRTIPRTAVLTLQHLAVLSREDHAANTGANEFSLTSASSIKSSSGSPNCRRFNLAHSERPAVRDLPSMPIAASHSWLVGMQLLGFESDVRT